MDQRKPLPPQQVAHALRHFILCGVLWAVYGPNATPAGSIFSGFGLHIGLSDAQIAFLVSLSSLAGTSQLVTFYLTRAIRNKRLFMVLVGQLEITSASAIVLTGLLATQFRFGAVAVLLVTAYLIGHTVNPHFSSWLSNVIPENVRAPYIGRRMFAITVSSMIWLYVASEGVDLLPKPSGFYLAFAVGWVAGLLGYWLLLVTPYPATEPSAGASFGKSLLEPMRNRDFRLLALFLCTWNVALSMAGALSGVYMIKYLGLSYSRIAIYTNITLALMMAGYLGTGALAQRYGSKPLTQIAIVPGLVVPALWAIMDKSNCGLLLPIACMLGGLSVSAINVALGSLLYKIVPSGVENSAYFANWTGLAALAAAIGPFLAGTLRNVLPPEVVLLGWQFNTLQAIFAASGVLYLFPLVLSAFIVEAAAASPRYVLGQFRGNLLGLAFSFALYSVARDNEARAEALRRLGRTKSPLALTPLVRGLRHVSHEVRSEAAKGLGEGQFAEAVEPLVEALEDKRSDIRPEAAEALGKIGHRAVAGPLLKALEDDDPRVRMSAALALGDVGGQDAQDALLQALRENVDPALFPTLVEAASHRPDLRIVEPVMAGLPQVSLPVIRMQVINGVCRVLGEKNHFYRLATADALERAGLSEPMMQRVLRLLTRAATLRKDWEALPEPAKQAVEALAGDNLEAFTQHTRQIAEKVLAVPDAPPLAAHAALAICSYLDSMPESLAADEGVVFPIIAMTALGRSLSGRHPQDHPESQEAPR
ncbi:MFS transporter [bacterium]|nr:MFS transporter [bacterium]